MFEIDSKFIESLIILQDDNNIDGIKILRNKVNCAAVNSGYSFYLSDITEDYTEFLQFPNEIILAKIFYLKIFKYENEVFTIKFQIEKETDIYYEMSHLNNDENK